MAKRIPASILRDFNMPQDRDDLPPSGHGSQRESSIIRLFMPGWAREMSDEQYLAFMPGIVNKVSGRPTREVSDRGRGKVAIDAARQNPARSRGGDAISMKALSRRAPTASEKKKGLDGSFASSVELFKGVRDTALMVIENAQELHEARKAFPLVVIHTDGGVFDPVIVEWHIRDFGEMMSKNIVNEKGWATWAGIPVRPANAPDVGRGGSPASVWVTFLRREISGYSNTGKTEYRFVKDDDGEYCSINTSCSRTSGTRFIAGSPEDFAADVDRATVLR